MKRSLSNDIKSVLGSIYRMNARWARYYMFNVNENETAITDGTYASTDEFNELTDRYSCFIDLTTFEGFDLLEGKALKLSYIEGTVDYK